MPNALSDRKEYITLNTKVDVKVYEEIKIMCIKKNIRIYEGINKALLFYINNKNNK